MKYKHIIFDIDGTMLDTEQVLLKALQQIIFETQGRKVEKADLLFTSGIPGDIALKQLGFEETEEVNKAWNDRFKENFQDVRIFDGIVPLLDKLTKMGVHLGIITSKTHEEYKSDFLPFGLEKYFGTIICVDDVDRPKPSPDSMFKYFSLTGASPEETLYIGDTIYDMQCAKSAGADFGLSVWGAASRYEGADYYFECTDEIFRLAE